MTALPTAARPPAANHGGLTTASDDAAERVVVPFPVVADIIGTPLRPIPDEHLARLHGDIEQARAIRRRLDRTKHVEIARTISWRDLAVYVVLPFIAASLVVWMLP